MGKASEKVTKGPIRQERGKKSHETYMKRLKEKILEDNQLPIPYPTDRSMPSTPSSTPPTSSSTGGLTPSTPSHTTRSNNNYVCGVGIYLLSLPLVFVYFLLITLFVKIKNSSMKTRINHQNDVICFRKICNKIGDCDCQKNIKKPIDDGSTVDATGAKKTLLGWAAHNHRNHHENRNILHTKGSRVGQHNALLTFTSLARFLSLPIWKMFFFF